MKDVDILSTEGLDHSRVRYHRLAASVAQLVKKGEGQRKKMEEEKKEEGKDEVLRGGSRLKEGQTFPKL